MSPVWHSLESLKADWRRLEQGLATWRCLWQLRAFEVKGIPWQAQQPALADWLQSLKPEQLTAWQSAPASAWQALACFDPLMADWLRDCHALPARWPQFMPQPAGRFMSGIPGRKAEQIQAFVAAMPTGAGLTLYDWCAGKGHLGRWAAHQRGAPLCCLERQPQLCQQGQALAQRQGQSLQYHCLDALSPEAAQTLGADQHLLALHACGDLHTQLLRQLVQRGCPQLSLSPCCYHLCRDDLYRPLSQAAQQTDLALCRYDLGLPLADLVTAGSRGVRLRETELLWRLAFDAWQRQARGLDQYLPLPAIPKALLSGEFSAFARWAAGRKGLDWPQGQGDDAYWLEQARLLRQQVNRLELVRHWFRRPLEYWLVLDQALFLAEQGYQVQWGIFCDYRVTPRNLLLNARQPALAI